MNMSPHLQAIMPILIVMLTAMIVLIGDSCMPTWRRARGLNYIVSLIGIAVAACFSLQMLQNDQSSVFMGTVVVDSFSQACNLILLLTAALAVLTAMTYLENKRLNLAEYYALVLFSTSGAMLMAASNDLIVLFISIEILSVALYVLAGFARTEERSEEAALKYFLLGAFAAGFLLYGIALIYGGSATAGGRSGAGTTNLTTLTNVLGGGPPSVMLMTGIALLLVGLAFKAALIPFHMWTPDVYEGAPTSVTAYMAASAKIGAFAAILRVFHAFQPISEYWLIAIQVLAVLTMFGGNILAVTQDNVKRMLAYSSIAHAGYLMVAVSAAVGVNKLPATMQAAQETAFSAAIFYLLSYALVTMGAFGVLIWLSRRGRDCQTLNDLKGLARTDPLAAYTMLIFMLSLGGIPPTMGFMGKWLIFNAALTAGQTKLAIALALASVISIYYYLRVVWMMCFQEPDTDAKREHAVAPFGVGLTIAITGIGSVVLGILPNLLNGLMTAASKVFHI